MGGEASRVAADTIIFDAGIGEVNTVTINPIDGKLVIEKTTAEERKPEPVAP